MMSRTSFFHLICGSIAIILVGCSLDVDRIVIELPPEVVEMPTQNEATLSEITSPTATTLPEPIPASSPTQAPTDIPTPLPRLATTQVQLTQGGCCVQPGFSADSSTVLFRAIH